MLVSTLKAALKRYEIPSSKIASFHRLLEFLNSHFELTYVMRGAVVIEPCLIVKLISLIASDLTSLLHFLRYFYSLSQYNYDQWTLGLSN